MLYKRAGSHYWWAQIHLGGNRHRFSTKRVNKKEAQKVVEAYLRRRLDGEQLSDSPPITLWEAVERNLSLSRGQSDQQGLKYRSDKLLNGYGGRVYHLDPGMLLHTLTRRDIDVLVQHRLDEGCAEGTIKRELTVFKKVVNSARKAGYRAPRVLEWPVFKIKGKLRFLSEEEELALLSELYPFRQRSGGFKPDMSPHSQHRRKLFDQYDLVVCLLDTGMRYSEVATLTWESVDTRYWKTVLVWRTKVDNEGLIGLTNRLRLVLQWRYEERGNSKYVFPGFGTDGPRGHATGGIMKAMTRAGINTELKVRTLGEATVHTLRDTFATRLVRRGVPIADISKLLGHRDLETTLKYAHLCPDSAAEKAAEVLNGYL